MMKQLTVGALALGASLCVAADLHAQSYPARPVTMVVPFPAGGSTDTIGRIMADGMRGPLVSKPMVSRL